MLTCKRKAIAGNLFWLIAIRGRLAVQGNSGGCPKGRLPEEPAARKAEVSESMGDNTCGLKFQRL